MSKGRLTEYEQAAVDARESFKYAIGELIHFAMFRGHDWETGHMILVENVRETYIRYVQYEKDCTERAIVEVSK